MDFFDSAKRLSQSAMGDFGRGGTASGASRSKVASHQRGPLRRAPLHLHAICILGFLATPGAAGQGNPNDEDRPQYFYMSVTFNAADYERNQFFTKVVFYPGLEECGVRFHKFSREVGYGFARVMNQKYQDTDTSVFIGADTQLNSVSIDRDNMNPLYRSNQVPVFSDRGSAESAKLQAIRQYQSLAPTSRGTRYVVSETDLDPGVTCEDLRPLERVSAPAPNETPSGKKDVGGIVLASPPTAEELARATEAKRKRDAAEREAQRGREREAQRKRDAVNDVMARTGTKDTPQNRRRAEELVALRNRIGSKNDESCKQHMPQFNTTNWLWFYKSEPNGESAIRAGMEARGSRECSRMTGGNPGHSVTDFQCVADGANADIYKLCSATIQCEGQAKHCETGGTAQ